jgi:DNA-binding NarL/FixJ family response regulator
MRTNSTTLGIDSVRESLGYRCTPTTRRRHIAQRHANHANPASPPAVEPVARIADRPSRLGRRPIDRLTRRQLEVLSLMAEGHSNAAIARLCYISEKAVVQHTSQIYDRLDLPNESTLHRRVHAVVIYLAEAA